MLEKNKYKSFEDREILPTKLCTHKDDVELINTRELEKIESEAHSYKAQDSGDGIGQFKVLNRLCPAAEVFKLKLNAQVILLKNLDVANSLVNGSRGCIVGFTETKMPIVKFLNGKKVTIKYDSWSFKINSGGQMATRRQLPLQLAWAISIHKSQVCNILSFSMWLYFRNHFSRKSIFQRLGVFLKKVFLIKDL